MINEASDWVKFCVNDVIKLASNKIALDLACGMGRNSIYLAKKGYKVISVDINSMSLSKFYQNNVYKIQSDIENLGRWPFKNNIFDIVIVTNFLNRLIFENIESVIKQNGYLVYETFGLGGSWRKWTSPDGAEIESSCILTTEPNDIVRPLHHRMPVVVPNGYEEQWTQPVKDLDELKGLLPIMIGWSSEGWLVEEIIKKPTEQMNLF